MGDLTNPKLIYLKGVLFLLCGALASGALLLEHPTLRSALLLALSVWCFARFYYFCFYVIGHYVDPAYRFAGSGRWRSTSYANGIRRSRTAGRGSSTRRRLLCGSAP